MAFASFGSLDKVLRRYSIRHEREEFVGSVPHPVPGEQFLSALRFTLQTVPYQRNEAFAGEAVVYPILKEAWQHYRDRLSFFSHEAVDADEDLRGELDYLICRRSPLGPFIPDQPILLVGEAKRDDIQRGWAQALAGMMAARALASEPLLVLYGLSTNGSAWSFGKLEGSVFTQDPRTFDVTFDAANVESLFGALHFLLSACVVQLDTVPAPSPVP